MIFAWVRMVRGLIPLVPLPIVAVAMHGCSNISMWALRSGVWAAPVTPLASRFLTCWAPGRSSGAQLPCQSRTLQRGMSAELLLRLCEPCVPPTAPHGCEVWGLHGLSTLANPSICLGPCMMCMGTCKGRAALATSHPHTLCGAC